MRMSRRPTSIWTGPASSISPGDPPSADASSSIRSWRPLSGCTERPALAKRPHRSSRRSAAHIP